MAPQKAEYQAGQAAYDEQTAALAASERQLEEGTAALAAAEKALADGKAELEIRRQEADDAIAAAEQKLADSRAAIADGEKQLADARQELADGETEYADGKKEADDKLSEAAQEIEEAQTEIDDIAMPEWMVLDRHANVSFVSFESNTEKVEAIAKVFPLFFFLVAALVALTTMTRMVEEERTQIGTLKALGYGKGAIAAKYALYCGAASVAGSVFGLLVGFQVFPTVIWGAYGIMYDLPKLIASFRLPLALASSLAAVACTLIAALSACYGSLTECAARLMLPRAPKPGKRVFLERIGPLWSRMRFTHKVTARNLIRYKKRFFMTVIGIAGCTALLVTGFGLRDSIGDIVDKQFGEIFRYNLTVNMKDPEAVAGDPAVRSLLEDTGRVSASLALHEEEVDVQNGGKTGTANLTIPQDAQRLPDFITLRERKSGKAVPFPAEGAILTEKLAETLGVKVGGEVTVTDGDGNSAVLRVSGITENYVRGYLYLSPETYTSAFGKTPSYDSLAAIVPDISQENRDEISTLLLKCEGVRSAQFTTDLSKSFDDMMKNIDTIVMVLIVCAGLLAFVVLYNLTNINITERQKEIATIKVLGFFDKEVSAYVYRETAVLSLIGTGCGLLLGIALHAFVVKTVEVDMVMFGRAIKGMSFLFAAVLTLLFSVLVSLVMYRKLKKIDMVESMKAGE